MERDACKTHLDSEPGVWRQGMIQLRNICWPFDCPENEGQLGSFVAIAAVRPGRDPDSENRYAENGS